MGSVAPGRTIMVCVGGFTVNLGSVVCEAPVFNSSLYTPLTCLNSVLRFRESACCQYANPQQPVTRPWPHRQGRDRPQDRFARGLRMLHFKT